LRPPCPSAFRASRWGAPVFSGGIRVKVVSSGDFTVESVRPWWCHRSCLLSAAFGGVQPHGSWHPFTTIRLQGFSSRSPAAVPRWRPPRRMTTSLVVGRSKSGCGLSPTLSFKDVHHTCCGGRQVEPGPYPPFGLVTRFFLQHSEGKGVHQSCGGVLGYTGSADCRLSATACLALWG
jgi:hypothetical protein